MKHHDAKPIFHSVKHWIVRAAGTSVTLREESKIMADDPPCASPTPTRSLRARTSLVLNNITFDQEKLRGHLLSCPSDGYLTEFPAISAPVQRACEAKVSYVTVTFLNCMTI